MRKTLSLTTLLSALAACGGGGGGGGADPAPDLSTLFFGSTDPAVSRSGLDYDEGTQNLEDLEGVAHTVQVVRIVRNTETDAVERLVTNETITIPDLGNRKNFTITLDGEALVFDEDGVATREDGTKIDSLTLSLPLESATTRGFTANELTGGRDDQILWAQLVTGFETSPEAIELAR